MVKFFLTFFSCFFLTLAYGQGSLDGTYVGLEEKCWTLKSGKKECYSDPSSPKRKWYNLTYIKIKGDSVFADQSPISIYKKDTVYSASDGGFYYFKGTVIRTDSVATIHLKFLTCDYCGISTEENPNAYLFPWTKNYNCKITAAGLVIKGFLFRRTNDRETLISDRPNKTK